MIPSFLFTIIMLVVFIYTIIVAFKQKRLTEIKNDFINNMTHEFKTPISSISIAAQMLNDDSVSKSPTMLKHVSSVINDETKRLRFQVEKVLQMSMFDNKSATMNLEEADADAIIDSVANTFKLKIEKYNLMSAKDNIQIGVKFLSMLHKEYNGDINLMLADYNGGYRQARLYKTYRYIDFVRWLLMSGETYNYVKKVKDNYRKLSHEF